MNYYYADSNNQPVGSISEDQLHELYRAGSVNLDTFVIPEGETEWMAYRTIALPSSPPSPLSLLSIQPPLTLNNPSSLHLLPNLNPPALPNSTGQSQPLKIAGMSVGMLTFTGFFCYSAESWFTRELFPRLTACPQTGQSLNCY